MVNCQISIILPHGYENARNLKTLAFPSHFKRIIVFGARFIDYKMGVLGAGVLAVIVFGINYHETFDLTGATTAALKQGTYTFLFGGSIMRGCQTLATVIRIKAVALAAATIIPSAVAICLTFGVHSLKGTPKPVASTIPTAVMVIPSTFIWGYRKRKQFTKHKIADFPSTPVV
jgi:peptidoglycan/LPS O-acetylase OafA/YrhL